MWLPKNPPPLPQISNVGSPNSIGITGDATLGAAMRHGECSPVPRSQHERLRRRACGQSFRECLGQARQCRSSSPWSDLATSIVRQKATRGGKENPISRWRLASRRPNLLCPTQLNFAQGASNRGFYKSADSAPSGREHRRGAQTTWRNHCRRGVFLGRTNRRLLIECTGCFRLLHRRGGLLHEKVAQGATRFKR